MFLDCHLKPCFPVESMFLFSSFFSFGWMGSIDSLLESFPAEVQPQQPGSAEGEDGLQTAWKELEPTPQLHAADDPIY